MSKWERKLETTTSLFEEGEYPMALICLDKNDMLCLRIEKNFVDHYRKVSPDGRAWMDGKLEEIFKTLKKTLTDATSQ